jgi:hypothetical protein
MDATAHYRQLAQLGRAAFLASAAPAALLRRPGDGAATDYDGYARRRPASSRCSRW